jgi:hypothetical protein
MSDDLDRELAALLSAHHAGHIADYRQHVREGPCCAAMAQMIAGLRADLWTIAERRDPWAA